jgi:Icc-related predicted phosphoesterase
MNILAMGDLHGRIPKLPKAVTESPVDVLLLCGDICGHFNKNWTFNDYFHRMVNVPAEGADQRDWLINAFKPWIDKTIAPKHTVFLNGNHDFGQFDGIFEHYLFTGSKTIEIEGVKFGLMTGMGQLAGEWHDEIPEEEFQHRIDGIDPDIQILVTHMPPNGILDKAYSGDRIGSRALTKAIFGSAMGNRHPYFTRLTHHFFGHAHEARGSETHEIILEDDEIFTPRSIVFKNVAETYAALEFKKELP